jgi:nitroreductase
METWDAIRARRDVRSYAERPIPEEDLHKILEAGRRAPSSQNKQRWDFVVVTDRAELKELSKVWQAAGHVAGSAATVALIAPKPADGRTQASVQYDLGQAAMSMMIMAADRGVGTGHSAVSDQDLAQRILGFPDDRMCAWLLPMGYPADRPLKPIERPNRRPFDEVVHRGHW